MRPKRSQFAPRLLLALAACTAFAATSNPAKAAVWEAKNAWSADWELKFSEWVRDSWDHHFFSKPGTPFTGLKLDCADTVYSMRVVFSFNNSLPYSMHDATGGKKPITNEMARWDKLATPNERVRKFIEYVYMVGSTHSLPYDTYPVAVSRETIRPGGLLLTDPQSHHSWTIKNITKVGIPHFVYSSRPAKTEILYKIGYPATSYIFPISVGIREDRSGGFRTFRQPEFIDIPVWQVPGYSSEQYKIPAAKWRETIQDKIALEHETPEQRVQRLLTDVCQAATERSVAVTEGLAVLAKTPGCMDAQTYDDYSTPNRDERMKNSFQELDIALADANAKIPEDFCPVAISADKTLTLALIRKRSLSDHLSNNPHDPIEYRWGESVGRSKRAKICPVYP